MATDPSMPLKKSVPKTVSPRHALLEDLIRIATKHAGDQYLDLANTLAGALIDATDGDTRAISLRLRAGNQLRNRNFAFLHLATSTLEKALRRELAELAPLPKGAQSQAEQPLSLVPYEEMDNKVAMSGVAKPFDVQYSDQLQTLNVRLGFLLDRDILRMNQNPFRPEVFLGALQQAWVEFDPEPESAPLLQPLLKPGMFIQLGGMLDALNLALQSKGVLPGSVDRYKGRKADSHTAAPARARSNQAALAQQLRQFFASSDVAGGMAGGMVGSAVDSAGVDLSIPDLPQSALQSGAAWAPNPAAAAGRAPAPLAPAGGAWQQGPAQGFHPGMNNEEAQRASQLNARQPLLNYLAALQKAVPYEAIGVAAGGAARSVPAGQAGGADPAAGTTAGNIAATTSAKVFYLPRIKESMPQGSLTRADESTIDLLSAIFDTVFRDQSISQEIRDLIRFLQIPVLKAALVDKNFFFQEAHPARKLIELMSRVGWEQRQAPDDPLFQAMQRSVDRVGRDYDHEMSVFTEAVNELEASIQAEEKAAAAAIAAPIAAALKQEKMAEAGKSARQAVAVRIATGEAIAIVETFLEQRWTSVLTIAYSIEESKPGAVHNATQTMDELIWSVKPKLNADERKQLISKLPGLLAALNKWLDVIKWQDAERLQFFAELAECHASIVRAPLDISAERQLEISVQVARQAAERRLALQAKSEAEAEAMAEAAADPDEEDAAIEVDGLARGMWLEFAPEQEGAGSRKVKLAWISPLRTLYIFATATRQEAFSISGAQLAERFRTRGVQIIRSEGVVSVALSQALSRSAVNDADMAPPTSAFG